jgi:hypothetical protein
MQDGKIAQGKPAHHQLLAYDQTNTLADLFQFFFILSNLKCYRGNFLRSTNHF